MQKKTKAATSFAQAQDGVPKSAREIELEAQLAAQDATIRSLKTENEILKNDIEDMATIANLDVLTSLTNRRGFEQRFSEIEDTNYTIVAIDMDGFKEVNDTFGHPVGDAILKEFSKGLRETFRDNSHTLARTGGDEFTLLLPGMSTEDASKSLSLLKKQLRCDTEDMRLKIYFSFAALTYSGQDPETLKAEVDAALYIAKQTKVKTNWKPHEAFDPSTVPASVMHPVRTPSSQPA